MSNTDFKLFAARCCECFDAEYAPRLGADIHENKRKNVELDANSALRTKGTSKPKGACGSKQKIGISGLFDEYRQRDPQPAHAYTLQSGREDRLIDQRSPSEQ